jgi:hypothetical protein
MKKLLVCLAVLLPSLCLFAQAPQKMSYQCVIRNTSGALVPNQSIGVKISILRGTPAGTLVFQEIYNPNPQTNANGLLSLDIGGGIPITGSFSSIDWALGPYFLKTETDPAGGTNYNISGTSQLLSVPYALHAKSVEIEADGDATNEIQYLNLTGNSLTLSKGGGQCYASFLGWRR